MAVFWEEVGWGWLPAVPFLCHNASRVVFAEGSLGKFKVAQFGADRLESLVGLSCPVGAAVLEHELVDRAVGLDRPGARPLMARPGVPDVALVDVDLSGLREVDQAWPLW